MSVPITNELLFTSNTTDIIDHHYSNKTVDHFFQYLLMGIDKLHDFGDFFTKVYDLVYNEHFYYAQQNKTKDLMGKKIIANQELVETSLKNKIGALHKLIDFISYKTNSPIVGAPILTFQTQIVGTPTYILNVNTQAPQTIPSVKITSLHDVNARNKYKLQIPPQRDVLLYITGKQNDFLNPNSFSALKDILDIKNPEYISKDAFPMNKDIIDGIFQRNGNFQSYTSELMDPATQHKDIVPISKNIKTLFCVLSQGKRLFLNAQITNKEINIKFELNAQKSSTPFTITQKIPTPSIQDVVIYLYYKEWELYTSNRKQDAALKAMKQNYGAKIMNMFKKNNKEQNTLAQKLDREYFMKLFSAIPGVSSLSHEDTQLISLATKTIGDQTYLWDALINDSTPSLRSQNIHGSFVTTVDSFLFDQIVHGKNANAVFSSKANGGLLRDAILGSNYQMVIYLKPLSVDLAASFLKIQEERKQSFIADYQIELGKLNKSTIQEGINNFKTKREFIVSLLIKMFSEFIPVGRRIPSHYEYNGTRIEAFDISNYYYAACYLLHFIIQCEISLSKVNEYEPVQITLETDMNEIEKQVNLIKSMNNSFDDAVSYYNGTLEVIVDQPTLYNYLNTKETVPGERSSLGVIVPQVGSAPDFESIKNSLNKNKVRLEQNMNGKKIPVTIGFSKGFFAIKGYIIDFFNGFSSSVLGGEKRGRESDEDSNPTQKARIDVNYNTRPETEEEFKQSIINVFPQNFSDYITEFGSGATIPSTHILPLDYYELFYLMKQLYYEDIDAYSEINTPDILRGGKKTADDFYVALYDFITEDLPDFWSHIRNSIEMPYLIQKRKIQEQQEQRLANQPKVDLRKLDLRTGFDRPKSAPVIGNTIQQPIGPATAGGKRKTKRKNRKSKKSNKPTKIKKTKKYRTTQTEI